MWLGLGRAIVTRSPNSRTRQLEPIREPIRMTSADFKPTTAYGLCRLPGSTREPGCADTGSPAGSAATRTGSPQNPPLDETTTAGQQHAGSRLWPDGGGAVRAK